MMSSSVDRYPALRPVPDSVGVRWRPVATPGEIRAAEQPLLAELGVGLMRRAAFALACEVSRVLRSSGVVSGRVVVLAGPGGNGGDALFAAAELARRGWVVEFFTVGDVHEGALAALLATGRARRVVDVSRMVGAAVIIDGLLGIGARGPLRPEAARLVAAAAGVDGLVVAVDLPSGLDPVTGVGDLCVRADVTVTFGALKPVHLFARDVCGEVVVCGVGIDEHLPDTTARLVVGGVWPLPGPRSHKYTGGVTGLFAGSEKYPGAGVLATAGAVRATSSMVRYAGGAPGVVQAAFPSVVLGAGRVDSVVVGPGYPLDSDRLASLLEEFADVPVVLDAEALRCVDASMLAGRRVLLTPHDGEFEALMGYRPGPDRVGAARAAAREFGAWVLLKGATTVVTDGEVTYLVAAPSSFAATPGSGDVLAGVLGALLAHTPSLEAVALGAFVHAQACAGLCAPVDASQLASRLSVVIAGLV